MSSELQSALVQVLIALVPLLAALAAYLRARATDRKVNRIDRFYDNALEQLNNKSVEHDQRLDQIDSSSSDPPVSR